MLEILLGFVAVVVVLGGVLIGFYNRIITLRNKVDSAFSDVDTQLKRRYDLIPNIMETVKGYVKHEKETLEKVTKLRAQAIDAGNMADQSATENMLSSALKSVFALAENYPELKADTSFLGLQENLSEVEEAINLSRRYYNGTVKDFNTNIEVFPGNIFAKFFNFVKRDFFEAEEGERSNVKVAF